MNWVAGIFVGAIALSLLIMPGATEGNPLAAFVLVAGVSTATVLMFYAAFPSMRKEALFYIVTIATSFLVTAGLWLIMIASPEAWTALMFYFLGILGTLGVPAAIGYMTWRHHGQGLNGRQPNKPLAWVAAVAVFLVLALGGYVATSLLGSMWQSSRYGQYQELHGLTLDEDVAHEDADWCPGIIEFLPWGAGTICHS